MNNRSIHKIVATKNTYKNATNIATLEKDLASYEKALKSRDYRCLATHTSEMNIIKKRLNALKGGQ